jgi:hypothetical protein
MNEELRQKQLEFAEELYKSISQGTTIQQVRQRISDKINRLKQEK